jgi:hypothetical protein
LRLKKLDPKFKTTEDFNNYSTEDQRAANEDVLDFLKKMDTADKKLRQEDSSSNSIFGDSNQGKENQSSNFAGQLQ